ncbi:MAG TPA: PspC domain-containing protein [Bacillota bacterium]
MKRLYRSSTNRMVAGVLGGIAEYFRVDPTVIRLLFVISIFVSLFQSVAVYLIAAVIIPDEREVH